MTVIVVNNGGGGGGTDLSQDDIAPNYVLEGKRFHNNRGEQKIGTIPNWSGNLGNGESLAGRDEKYIIEPDDIAHYIPAGRYLNKDIEIPAKEVGSVSWPKDEDDFADFSNSKKKNNSDTVKHHYMVLTKEAGYINAGTPKIWLPNAVVNKSRSGATVTVAVQSAGYAEAKSYSETVPLDNEKPYGPITANGTYRVEPSNGKVGMERAIVTVNVPTPSAPSLGSRTLDVSQNGQTFNAGNYSLDGFSSVTVNITIPAAKTASVSVQGTGILITGDAGKTIASVSLVANNRASGCVMAGHVINSGAASSTGRAVVEQSNGDVALGNVLRAIFNGNTVTITATDGWNFNGADYTACVSYK